MMGHPAYHAHLENSLRQAHARHGHEEFEEAYCAFLVEVRERGNQALWRRIMNSSDIGEALVQWHRMNSEDQENCCHGC
jgi:hypothetical protein